MKYEFLDAIGLKQVLNTIKETFIPKERKIANIDLKNDINAEELAANLNEYIGGQNGKSAYEVAVDNGFEGSERRWLESLKGKSGVYVGSGEMPEDCNVQIDPNGEVFEIDYSYDPTSLNPQSGIAVAEAINLDREFKNFNLSKEEGTYQEDVLKTLTDKNYIGIVHGQYNLDNEFPLIVINYGDYSGYPDYLYESWISPDLTITQHRTFLVFENGINDSSISQYYKSSREYKQIRQATVVNGEYEWSVWRQVVGRGYVNLGSINSWSDFDNKELEQGYLYDFYWQGNRYLTHHYRKSYPPYADILCGWELNTGKYTIFNVEEKTITCPNAYSMNKKVNNLTLDAAMSFIKRETDNTDIFFVQIEEDYQLNDTSIIFPKGNYCVFFNGYSEEQVNFLSLTTGITYNVLETYLPESQTYEYTITSSENLKDEGNYFTNKTVEGAFQEIGAQIKILTAPQVFYDRTTNIKYSIYVDNGELKLEEVDE